MASTKISWTKTDLSHIADLNGDYRKLNSLLSDSEKTKCDWKQGITRFNYNQASTLLKCLFPFLTDEQVITLLYKQKSISQVI